MGARQTKNELMKDEWEFDTRNELVEAAKKEAVVCGDEVRWLSDGAVEIFNRHQYSVRWKGFVGEFTVTLTRGEVELLREGDGTDIEAVISDILRQVEHIK